MRQPGSVKCHSQVICGWSWQEPLRIRGLTEAWGQMMHLAPLGAVGLWPSSVTVVVVVVGVLLFLT